MLKKQIFWFSVWMLWLGIASAQAPFTRSNSPYSRYGLGDLFPMSFSPVAANGLGGAYNSYFDVNLVNPAALSELRHVAFDVGAYYKHSWLSEASTGKKAEANDGNLSYLSLAFPIWRPWKFEKDTLRRFPPIHWGMSLGLYPHSRVGYSVRITRKLDNIGDVLYNYEGQGSRFLVNWGNGWKYKGFSLGVNIGFLFGKTTYTATENFIDSIYNVSFDNSSERSQYARGFVWDLGFQYEHVFKNKKASEANTKQDLRLTVGVYGNGGSNAMTINNELTRRYGLYYGSDTLVQAEESKGKIHLPGKIGGGISVGKDFQWMAGVNFQQEWWSAYFNDHQPENLSNTFTLSAGGEYWIFYGDANLSSTGQFRRETFKKLILRLGGYYGKDPRTLQSDAQSYQLDKYGITFGLGIPVSTKDAQDGEFHPLLLNLGFEWGYLGHKALIQEQFFKVNLGFTLTGDKWFIRPKFR